MKLLNRNIRIFSTLFFAMFRNTAESKTKILLDIFLMAMRLGLLLVVYYALFQHKGGMINGENFQTIAWSIFIYFAYLYINPRVVTRNVQEDIRSGRIQDLLVKPFSYLLYRMAFFMGSSLYQTISNLLIFSFLMIIFIGIPTSMQSLFFILSFITVFILGFVLTYLIFISLGMCAFWMEDVVPLQWVIDKFLMVLGGAYLPVALFPEFMKQIAVWSPFGAALFITHTPYFTWASNFKLYVFIQMFWLIVFSFILFIIFNKAMKRVVTNGG